MSRKILGITRKVIQSSSFHPTSSPTPSSPSSFLDSQDSLLAWLVILRLYSFWLLPLPLPPLLFSINICVTVVKKKKKKKEQKTKRCSLALFSFSFFFFPPHQAVITQWKLETFFTIVTMSCASWVGATFPPCGSAGTWRELLFKIRETKV